MIPQREMTLDEWCWRLPQDHLVNIQLNELKAQADKLAEDLKFYQIRSYVPVKRIAKAYADQGHTYECIEKYTERARNSVAEYRKFKGKK